MDWNLPGSTSMDFSRQEYWSGLPFLSPGYLPDPGIKPRSSSLQAYSLPSDPPGKPSTVNIFEIFHNKMLWGNLSSSHFRICLIKWHQHLFCSERKEMSFREKGSWAPTQLGDTAATLHSAWFNTSALGKGLLMPLPEALSPSWALVWEKGAVTAYFAGLISWDLCSEPHPSGQLACLCS